MLGFISVYKHQKDATLRVYYTGKIANIAYAIPNYPEKLHHGWYSFFSSIFIVYVTLALDLYQSLSIR